MNILYEGKMKFVEGKLTACLKAANCGVDHLVYHRKCEEGSPEFVTICFNGGGKRTVDVSGDSHLAIIKDVLKHF